MKEEIPIVEIFEGIQGEGEFMGRLAIFVRFGGCNLRCRFCDTNWEEYEMFSLEALTEEIYKRIRDMLSKAREILVVFTGGEPLLYHDEIFHMMKEIDSRLKMDRFRIDWQIETNGTIPLRLEKLWCMFASEGRLSIVISPKRGAKVDVEKWKNIVLSLAIPIIVKFVVGEEENAWYGEELKGEIEKWGQFSKIYLMPLGARCKELKKYAKYCWEKAIEWGVNYSDRLHIRVFGEAKKGV